MIKLVSQGRTISLPSLASIIHELAHWIYMKLQDKRKDDRRKLNLLLGACAFGRVALALPVFMNCQPIKLRGLNRSL